MLRRAAVLVTASAAVFTALAPVHADGPPAPPPVSVTGDFTGGSVTTSVQSTGHSPKGTVTDVSSTGDSSNCVWMQLHVWERLPLPPENVAHGTWWIQYCNKQGYAGTPQFVPDNAANAPTIVVTPGVLAESAVNELQLPSPTAAHNPPGDATTNLAVWFWIPRSQWHPLSQTTRAGNVWARVTATPVSTSWDPGDGSTPVVCSGAGTPYDRSRPADEQSSDCAHTYKRSSASQPQTGPDPNDRFFSVRVSVVWRVTWVGAAGANGQLPDLTRVATFQLRVDDREAVVTSSS